METKRQDVLNKDATTDNEVFDGEWTEGDEAVRVPNDILNEGWGGATVKLTNIDYFLAMFADMPERYLRPYEILANFDQRVVEQLKDKETVPAASLESYFREPTDGECIFEFSHFEVDTDPVFKQTTLYICYEFTGTAA